LAIHIKHGVVLAGACFLAACSSDPSPWSQSSSPWGHKGGQVEEVAVDENSQRAEQPAFVEPMPAPESAYAPIEPVGVAATESMPAEPMQEMPVAEPAAAPEPVPMMEDVAVAGDLRSQPAGHFAVQVCASRTLKQLAYFAKHHGLSDEWTAQTSVNGETWFVLLEGVYATKAEAREALDRVSSQVDTKPWIRSVGSLQAVMQ
jgi:DamX protein